MGGVDAGGVGGGVLARKMGGAVLASSSFLLRAVSPGKQRVPLFDEDPVEGEANNTTLDNNSQQ